MPPKKSRKRAAEEDYDSDGGFVKDAPKSKKSKATTQAPTLAQELQQDDDGNDYWQISGKRRLVVSEYKGNTMINIREFYEKDGKSLPGKAGISLPIEQYKALIELLPQIESSLEAKGIEVPRPQYDGGVSAKPVEDEDRGAAKVKNKEEEEEDEEPVKPSNAASKLEKFKLKQNHEATSDEDDG